MSGTVEAVEGYFDFHAGRILSKAALVMCTKVPSENDTTQKFGVSLPSIVGPLGESL